MGEGATADQGCSCTLTQFDHPQTRHNGAPEGAGAALAKRRVSLCPTVRRLQVQDLGSNPGPLSLAGRWLSPPRVLMWFSFCVSVSSSPLVRAAVTLDRVHPVTSLYFIHIVKGPSCRQSRSERCWGVTPSTQNLGGGPQCRPYCCPEV